MLASGTGRAATRGVGPVIELAKGLTSASTAPLMAAVPAVPGIAARAAIASSSVIEPAGAR